MLATSLAIISAGAFFLFGLVTGVFKYQQIMSSPKGRAHYYMDVCHRASLMYAFACLLLFVFADISQLSNAVEVTCILVLVIYFATAVASYFFHGLRQDTNNQLRLPPKNERTHGQKALPLYMWTLIGAEIGGFCVLFYGVIKALI